MGALHPQFIFLNDDSQEIAKSNSRVYPVFVEEYQRQDLTRYCTKLYYDKDIPIDFSKQIKIALSEYLTERIGETELAEMEAIKKNEAAILEAERKARIPKYSWDLNKINKTKKGE